MSVMALLGSCANVGNIGLSTKNIELKYDGDTAVVTTKSADWNIESVEIGGKTYSPSLDELGSEGKTFEWLTMRADETSLTVIVAPNADTNKRLCSITVKGKSGSEKITCCQEGMTVGDWKDVIQANPKELEVKPEGETVRVQTKSYWWICTITAGDEVCHSTREENLQCSGDMKFEKTVGWLTVKRDANDVVITAEPNKSGIERTFSIVLGEGDYYCTVTGVQKAE